jgi:hypothetical protein
MSTTQTFVTLGIVITLLWGLSLWLLKQQITHVFAEVKRLPPEKWFNEIQARVASLPGPQWFDEVHKSIKALPDPERLAEHFKRGHELSNEVNIVKLHLADMKMELKEQKESHKETEDRVARLENRLERLDGKKDQDRRNHQI